MTLIDAQHVPLSVREDGRGDPLLLLHGSAASSDSLSSLAGALSAHHRVLRLDLPGYGDSPRASLDQPLTLDALVRRVEAIAARAGAPVHLVGHGLGGAVALHAGLTRPSSVRSLTLIEPVAFHLLRYGSAQDRGWLAEVTALRDRMADLTPAGRTAEAMAAFVDSWSGPGVWAGLTPRDRVLLARQAHLIVRDLDLVLAEVAPPAAYRRITVPTLILAGGRSPAPTRRIAELLRWVVPASTLTRIEEAGHALPRTHPLRVAAPLLAHLAASAPAGVQPRAA